MLGTIAAAITARLEGLTVFKVVERGFSKRALQSPPSAVFYLAEDQIRTDKPSPTRTLAWDIALLVSYLDPVRGQETMETLIDLVRPAFTNWRPVAAGCLPASVPHIRFEANEDTLLVYSVRVTMDVFPNTIT
jgi:hypothetical protein